MLLVSYSKAAIRLYILIIYLLFIMGRYYKLLPPKTETSCRKFFTVVLVTLPLGNRLYPVLNSPPNLTRRWAARLSVLGSICLVMSSTFSVSYDVIIQPPAQCYNPGKCEVNPLSPNATFITLSRERQGRGGGGGERRWRIPRQGRVQSGLAPRQHIDLGNYVNASLI